MEAERRSIDLKETSSEYDYWSDSDLDSEFDEVTNYECDETSKGM